MGTLNFSGVTYHYGGATSAALNAIEFNIAAGEFVLVAGPSGSGKSTMLRAANGIVPHLTGGAWRGTVTVGGRSTRDFEPRKLADVVGFVHQDPEAQFVVDHVESDIAFVLENLGHDAVAMRRRVEEVLDALAIAHLRDRDASTLSGGERQRVAIAGALAAAPSVMVLDEPTSQLDPQGADDVLAALSRLNSELGTTIVLAEHRLERAAPLADRALLIRDGRLTHDGTPATVLVAYEGAPTVTQLGRALGWDPLPLTVKAARTRAASDTRTVSANSIGEGLVSSLHDGRGRRNAASIGSQYGAPGNVARPEAAGDVVVHADKLDVRFAGRSVLRVEDFALHSGEIIALLGRNGAGKSTLLRALGGLQRVDAGKVHTAARIAYVPQDPNSLFSAATVRDEVVATLRLLGHKRDDARADAWLERLALTAFAARHPRELSGGQRQRLAIAVVAVGGAPVLLLDEPTRGMDAPSRSALEAAITEHATAGGTVVVATHDVELAARVATRVIVLGDGEVVADGEARSVLAGSLFAPQVLRVLPPLLTVAEAIRWYQQ